MRGPHVARTGIARGPWGVLWIIRWNHQRTAMLSYTGPVAWCDHENSTGVKFLRALHSTLRARNRTGAKIVRDPCWMWLRHKTGHIKVPAPFLLILLFLSIWGITHRIISIFHYSLPYFWTSCAIFALLASYLHLISNGCTYCLGLGNILIFFYFRPKSMNALPSDLS